MATGSSFYEYGYGQAIGGSINDVLSYSLTGGSIGPLSDFMENPTAWNSYLLGSSAVSYLDGLYYDLIPLKQ